MEKKFVVNQKLLNKKFFNRFLFYILVGFISCSFLILIFYFSGLIQDFFEVFLFVFTLCLGVFSFGSFLRYLRLFNHQLIFHPDFLERKSTLLPFDLEIIRYGDVKEIWSGPDWLEEKLGLSTLYLKYIRKNIFGAKNLYLLKLEGFTSGQAEEIGELINKRIN